MHKRFSWWCVLSTLCSGCIFFSLSPSMLFLVPLLFGLHLCGCYFCWMIFVFFLASVSIPIRCRIRLVSFHVGNVFLTFTQFLLNVAVSKEAWLLLSFYKNLYQSSLSGFWCFIVSSIYCFVLLLQFSFFVFQLDIITILFSLSLHFS